MSDGVVHICMTIQVAVRLPDDLLDRLDSLVPATHPSRSDAVRRAIELYLYALACEQDAGEAKCGGQILRRDAFRSPITRLSATKMREACGVLSRALACV